MLIKPKEECLSFGLKLPLGALKDHINDCGRYANGECVFHDML